MTPISPSTRVSSSPMSASNVSWPRRENRRRYTLETPPKYTTFDDEGSSSEKNDDLSSLFAKFTVEQKEKINELIKSINEKDGILDCQEDLLVKEYKKFVKLKDAFDLEVENCKNLTNDLPLNKLPFVLDVEMLMLML
jgi:hypothetical protein